MRTSTIACAMLCALISAPLSAAQSEWSSSLMSMGTNCWWHDPGDRAWDMCAKANVAMVRIGGAAYDRKMPDNQTLASYVRRIQGIGAEPLIQVSCRDAPERMADIVRVFNKELITGRKVRYWSIGNEPLLRFDRPGQDKLPGLVEAYFKPIAAAMKQVDPTILIAGPDECDYLDRTYEALFGGKHDISGKVPGKDYHYCDIVTWHRYPGDDGEPGLGEIEDVRRRMVRCQKLVDRVNAQSGRSGSKALRWGITEFNATDGKRVHTFDAGQLFGGVLGYARLHGAHCALSWSIYESGGNRGRTDFSLFDGKGLVPRPAYWHLAMWGGDFSGETVPVVSGRKPAIGFASRKQGQLSVMLLNTGIGDPIRYSMVFAGGASGASADFLVDIGKPGGYQGVLGPRSTQVLIFSNGKVVRKQYTADDFADGSPPDEKVEATSFRP